MRFMGTGKTQKMLEEARDALLAGHNILVLTTNELHSRELAARFRDLVAERLVNMSEDERAKLGKGRTAHAGENLAGEGPWEKLYIDHYFIECQARLTSEQWRQVVTWYVGTVLPRIRAKLEPLPTTTPHPLEQRVREYEENVPGPNTKKT